MKTSSLKLFVLVCAGLLAGCTDDSSDSGNQCTPDDLSQCAPGQVCSDTGECVDEQKSVVEENTQERCKDKVDNDNNGTIDCNDPGCAAFVFCQLSENTEAACKDSIDNDGDGAIDCNDPGCAAFSFCQLSENTEAACKDKVDNDNNGTIDCNDPGCAAFVFCQLSENTEAACKDKVDNDNNGTIDCNDPGCAAFSFCQLSENTEAACKDSIDNDGDGAIDCNDSGCAAFSFCQLSENTEAACKDSIDNDGDGAIDCNDSGCAAFSFCQPFENTESACQDGLDNDNDGEFDCNDTDCAAFCVENTEELCKDGTDNDGDGKNDCDDTDCAAFCQGKCDTNQTWLPEYEVCAWNISSASALTSLKDEWNANGDTKYVIEAGKKVAFVLTKNIPLGNVDWEGIGTSTHPFNGIFYGNDYTISGQFSNTPGLFGNVKDAILAHTKLVIQYRFTNDKTIANVGALAGYAENVTVNNVETNSDMNDVKTDNVNRNYGGLIGSGDGVFKDIKVSSSFDNKTYNHRMGGFICETNSDIQLTNIDVNSTLKTFDSFYYAGMIYKIQDTVSKVEINNANIVLNDYVCENCDEFDGNLYAFLGECRAKNIVIDGLDLTIKNLSSNANSMYLITYSNFVEKSGPGSEKMSINRMRIRNLTNKSIGYFYNQSNLTVKNSDLGISDSLKSGDSSSAGTWSNIIFYNSEFGTSFIFRFNNLYLYNSYFTRFSSSLYGSYSQFVFNDSVYKDTITFTGNNSVKFESEEKTVKILNENLKNSIYLPEGKYAPWTLDASGNVTLDLDAPDDQWVEF